MNKPLITTLALFAIFTIFIVDDEPDLTRKANNYCFEKYGSFEVVRLDSGFICKNEIGKDSNG